MCVSILFCCVRKITVVIGLGNWKKAFQDGMDSSKNYYTILDTNNSVKVTPFGYLLEFSTCEISKTYGIKSWLETIFKFI